MLYRNGFAALAAISALGLGHCAASAQHAAQAHGVQAPAMPAADDVHVVQLYELMKDVLAKGADKVDRVATGAKLKEIAAGHAAEMKGDPVQMEHHLIDVMHKTMAIAQAHPEVLASVQSFHAAIHSAAGTPDVGKPAHATTQTLQPGAGEWKKAPQMREFYEAAKTAFANGPKKVDVKAFEKRSREIFIAFADSMGAPREGMLDHLKDIPKQVVQIVKEDPKVLDSYDNFWVALSGPE